MPLELFSNSDITLMDNTGNYISLLNNTNSTTENNYIQKFNFQNSGIAPLYIPSKDTYSFTINNNLRVQAYAIVQCQEGDILYLTNDNYEYRYGIYNNNKLSWYGTNEWYSSSSRIIEKTGLLLLNIRIKVDSNGKFPYVNCYDANKYFYLQLINPENKLSLPATVSDANNYFESILFYGDRKTNANKYNGDLKSATFRIPGIEITNNNVLLCTSEARYDSVAYGSDETIADIAIARSFDYGKTWIDKKVIFLHDQNIQDVSNTRCRVGALLCDRVTNRVFVFSTKINLSGKVTSVFSDNTKTKYNTTLVYKYSDDDGETWSEEISLEGLVRTNNMVSLFPAVGKGINLSNGYLVVPLRYYHHQYTTVDNKYVAICLLLYSTDHGVTWNVSQDTVNKSGGSGTYISADENSIILYLPNKILLNSRGGNAKTRKCLTLSPIVDGQWDTTVPWLYTDDSNDPITQGFDNPNSIGTSLPDLGCQGCMDAVNYLGKNIYFVSNQNSTAANATITIQKPNNEEEQIIQRIYLTFKYSFDCLNWNSVFMPKLTRSLIGEDKGNFGYSNMTIKDGIIYYVYEDGGNINFIKIPISLMLSLPLLTNSLVGE